MLFRTSMCRAFFTLFAMCHFNVTQTLNLLYSSVIDAYAKCGDPISAERILIKMRKEGIQPDSRIYNTLIQAWAYSQEPRKARKAKLILLDLKNTVGTSSNSNISILAACNSILQACALTSDPREKAEAMEIAREIFS